MVVMAFWGLENSPGQITEPSNPMTRRLCILQLLLVQLQLGCSPLQLGIHQFACILAILVSQAMYSLVWSVSHLESHELTVSQKKSTLARASSRPAQAGL
jgi:hypothetical protein